MTQILNHLFGQVKIMNLVKLDYSRFSIHGILIQWIGFLMTIQSVKHWNKLMKWIQWFSSLIWLQNVKRNFWMNTPVKLIESENLKKIMLQFGILDRLIQLKMKLWKMILKLPKSAYYKPFFYQKITYI